MFSFQPSEASGCCTAREGARSLRPSKLSKGTGRKRAQTRMRNEVKSSANCRCSSHCAPVPVHDLARGRQLNHPAAASRGRSTTQADDLVVSRIERIRRSMRSQGCCQARSLTVVNSARPEAALSAGPIGVGSPTVGVMWPCSRWRVTLGLVLIVVWRSPLPDPQLAARQISAQW